MSSLHPGVLFTDSGNLPSSSNDGDGDREALEHLGRSLAQGAHWFIALLEAVALWRSAEEEYEGRHYRYLVGGEAFDWLLLAERLCEELREVVPESEKEALLFFGRFPVDIGPWEFQQLIGRAKYRAHLNFWYGVLTEEALLLAVEERIAKERAAVGFGRRYQDHESRSLWVYGVTERELLEQFRCDKGLAVITALSLAELQEFTYWCFKYRLLHRDPAKVASDTRLGLEQLQRMRSLWGQGRRIPYQPSPS